MSLRDSMMARFQQLMQERQQQDATALENARTQPIPGFTGPPSAGQIPGMAPPPGVGMAPPQQPLPGGQALQPFMTSGPYGQHALQLAGLMSGGIGGGMGNHMLSQPGNIQTQQGLLGGSTDKFRTPFYRPVGK